MHPTATRWWGKLLAAPTRLWRYAQQLRRFHPDLVISKSSPYAAVTARFFGARTVIMPDSEGVWLIQKFVGPFSDYVVTPASFREDYGKKHLRVSGIFEAGYLHPSRITPDASVLDEVGLIPDERFFIVRFVAWGANHDVTQSGIDDTHKIELVRRLSTHGRVFVTAEAGLPAELEPCRLKLAPSRIHDLLHFASLYVGDSQTMATEAALLGTPAVRCNSFVGTGDMSTFELLEKEFAMIWNVRDPAQSIEIAESLAGDADAKSKALERRAAYFEHVGDVNLELLERVTEIAGGRS